MGFLAGILGSGAGVIIIGASIIALPYLSKLKIPNTAQALIRRFLIVATYSGGCTLAFSEIGTIWAGLANRAADLFGGMSTGIPFVVVTLSSVVLLLGLAAALVAAPTDAVVVTAAFIPAVLMLVPGGAIHQVFVFTAAPGQALAAAFTTWLAG